MRKTAVILALAMMAVATNSLTANEMEPTPVVVELKTSFDAEISSFCKAIVQGDIETVKRMIELGEDVNQKSAGMTPAIFAARYNKAEILSLLISNGANLKLKSDKGWTIKKYAELSNAEDALEVIKKNT